MWLLVWVLAVGAEVRDWWRRPVVEPWESVVILAGFVAGVGLVFWALARGGGWW